MTYTRGKHPNSISTRFQKGRVNQTKGKHRPELSGEKHPLWKGADAAYSNKHHWVRRWYGPPTHCEMCPKSRSAGNMIHWASRSRECKRVRSDWAMLCVSCHKLYDLGKLTIKKYVSQ